MRKVGGMSPILVVRRAHLLIGLFLAPWVLVYGVSGLAFHHWSWFSNWPKMTRVTFEPEQITVPTPWLQSEILAKEAVAAINSAGGADYVLVPGSEQLDPIITMPLTWQGASGDGKIQLLPRMATLREFQPGLSPQQIATTLPAIFDAAATARVRSDATKLFRVVEPSIRDIEEVKWPALTFLLRREGQIYSGRRDLVNGTVSVMRVPGPRVPNFLTSLHMTHWNFATGPWIRTLWATISDGVALALIFWALSGLIMWWQMKPLRAPGRIVFLVSLVVAFVIVYGMWHELRV